MAVIHTLLEYGDASLDTRFSVNPMRLLEFFRTIAVQNSIGVVTVDWLACDGCGLPAARYPIFFDNEVEGIMNVSGRTLVLARLHWRLGDKSHGFSMPVTYAYRLFLRLVSEQKQWLGGNRKIETFTNRDVFFRPKFPQLFIFDGKRIPVENFNLLFDLYSNDELFWRASGDERIFHQGALIPYSSALPNNAVTIQLNNYNLYSEPGDQNHAFNERETQQTLKNVARDMATPEYGRADHVTVRRSPP